MRPGGRASLSPAAGRRRLTRNTHPESAGSAKRPLATPRLLRSCRSGAPTAQVRPLPEDQEPAGPGPQRTPQPHRLRSGPPRGPPGPWTAPRGRPPPVTPAQAAARAAEARATDPHSPQRSILRPGRGRLPDTHGRRRRGRGLELADPIPQRPADARPSRRRPGNHRHDRAGRRCPAPWPRSSLPAWPRPWDPAHWPTRLGGVTRHHAAGGVVAGSGALGAGCQLHPSPQLSPSQDVLASLCGLPRDRRSKPWKQVAFCTLHQGAGDFPGWTL